MGAGNRVKTKTYKSKQQWLYPYQYERKYAKEITALQKLFTKPLTAAIDKNISRWISEYNRDNTDGIKIDESHEDVFSKAAFIKRDEDWLEDYKNGKLNTDEFKTDVFGLELRELIAAEQARMNLVYGENAPTVRAMITDIGDSVSAWNLKQFGKFTKDILGVEFFVTEPWETEVIEAWGETNFELIKSLSSEYIKTVNTLVSEGVQFGKTANEIMAGIRATNKQIEGWRSRLIARDQVGKLNGALTKRRNTDAGIDMYIWMTANDERVRSKHKPLDNKVCKWGNSSVYSDNKGKTFKKRGSDMFIGIPGQDIQCRCGSQPFFDDMIAEIDEEIKEEAA